MSHLSSDAKVTAEVADWFFGDYLPTWEGVGNGSIEGGPEFILDYWGTPLFDYYPEGGDWALDSDGVVALLATTHTRLQAHHYAYTAVLDRTVRSYHRNGAAIEVIWSRRRADHTEIERLAVHFEVLRTSQGWRVAGIQRRGTAANSLIQAWAD